MTAILLILTKIIIFFDKDTCQKVKDVLQCN